MPHGVDVVTAVPALQLRNLVKRFGVNCALDDVSLQVAPGEVVCLVGPSGCGKTTLLRMISGVEVPDSGNVDIAGQTMVGAGAFVEPEKRQVGVVFQDYALFPHLTVKQNVMFGLRGQKREQAQLRAGEMMALVGLERMSERYPHMLSGGEQQRVALARALASKPAIILMDEPFSNLDRGLRERVRHETISLLRSLGTSVIIVTHDAEEALSTGDRIVLMRSGKIVQTGTPQAVYDHPCCRYVADFFCNFNILSGQSRSGKIETALGFFECSQQADGEVFVYLRPRHMQPILDEDRRDGDIAAVIKERIFLGDYEELILETEASKQLLRARLDRRISPKIQHLHVRLDKEQALFFDMNGVCGAACEAPSALCGRHGQL